MYSTLRYCTNGLGSSKVLVALVLLLLFFNGDPDCILYNILTDQR